MSIMPAAIVINQPDAVSSADNATATAASAAVNLAVNLYVQEENAQQKERQRTRAIIADFEAHFRELTNNPPADLSPIKLQAHLEALEHTIKDLRRQIAPRRKPGLSSS